MFEAGGGAGVLCSECAHLGAVALDLGCGWQTQDQDCQHEKANHANASPAPSSVTVNSSMSTHIAVMKIPTTNQPRMHVTNN